MTRGHFMIGFLLAFAALTSASIPVLAADGDLDPTFGIGGKVRYEDSLGYRLSGGASTIQSDGKIVVAGSIGVNDDSDFVLVRYNRDGSLDTDFGAGGRVTADFSGQRDEANALAIQPDGKILATGWSGLLTESFDFALARYNPNGSLDTTFGVGGKTTTDFSGLLASALALGLQSDGKIVAAGSVVQSLRSPYSPDFALARYNPDGSLDMTFGIDGKVITDFSGRSDQARALAIQSDGKIVAAGIMALPPDGTPYSGIRSWRGALVRYNKDGSLDTNFGTGGKIITEILGTSEINALSIQSDGKIIAAGRSALNDIGRFLPGPTGGDFGLVRYNQDGSLDTTFGAQGIVRTDLNTTSDVIYAVSLQPDGKIIVAGDSDLSDWGYIESLGIARYHRDGSLDPTFGIGGKVKVDLPVGQFAQVRSVGIQPDGKIVVTGIGAETFDEYFRALDTFFELARYDTAGLHIVSAIKFDAAIIPIGGSWSVTMSGSSLSDRTWFDLRFRAAGSTADQVALNWQQGTSAHHIVAAGTEAGTWIVTGIRAHESANDHDGEFVTVSVFITVTGG